MFSLISKNDNKFMENSSFVKNAVFYKDMFAFFDAYEKLTAQSKNSLPDFCLQSDEKFNLDGVCLFMKLYASDLGFETIKLSVDYLKVLYYTIAGYANSDGIVNIETIKNEFNQIKNASVQIVEEAKSKHDESEKIYNEKLKNYSKLNSKYATNFVFSKINGVFTTIFFVTTFFLAMLPFTVYFMGKIKFLSAVIFSADFLFVGFLVYFVIRHIAKTNETVANDSAYQLQMLKKYKDQAFSVYKEEKNNLNNIISEQYEYITTFSEDLAKFSSKMSFDKLFEKFCQKDFKLALDGKIDVLFETYDKVVEALCQKINQIDSFNQNDFELLSDLYTKIADIDELYFNCKVRFNYIKKFAEIAEHTNQWVLKFDGNKILPFGIDVKSMVNQNVAYLKSKDDLFVASSMDKYLDSEYVKKLSYLESFSDASAEMLKTLKVEYINHFYNYEKVKDYNNLFESEKFAEGVKVSDDILLENKTIPTYVYLKIKLIESNIGLGNSDSEAVKNIIADILNKSDSLDDSDADEQPVLAVQEPAVLMAGLECDSVQEIANDLVEYEFGALKIKAHKLSNI